MFTGLIEKVGRWSWLRGGAAGGSLAVEHEPWDPALSLGESVSVQGVCLTVVQRGEREFVCDVLAETLGRTNLGGMAAGAPVNLERALRAGDRFGGHFLTGHVDGRGTVRARRRAGRDWVLAVDCQGDVLEGIVPKGSVACDGVSLTISRVLETGFEVNIVPFTWEHTALSRLSAGDAVNIETDMIGKYVRRYLGAMGTGSGVSMEALAKAGFL
jgi:riboflavin synthase